MACTQFQFARSLRQTSLRYNFSRRFLRTVALTRTPARETSEDEVWLNTDQFGVFTNRVVSSNLKSCALLVITSKEKMFGFHFSARQSFDEDAMNFAYEFAKQWEFPDVSKDDFKCIDSEAMGKDLNSIGAPEEILLVPCANEEVPAGEQEFVQNEDIDFLLDLISQGYQWTKNETLEKVTILRGVEESWDTVSISRDSFEVFKCIRRERNAKTSESIGENLILNGAETK